MFIGKDNFGNLSLIHIRLTSDFSDWLSRKYRAMLLGLTRPMNDSNFKLLACVCGSLM